MKRTFVLVVMDGWGIGRFDESNPIYMEHPQSLNYIQTHFPSGGLQSYGIAVGLPWNEEGNSEVGHLTLGAGKILYQHFTKITMAIQDGSFFENKVLKESFAKAKEKKSAIHLVGLLTHGGVHASMKHLVALIQMAKQEKCKKLYLQLFSDGLDSSPKSILKILKDFEEKIIPLGYDNRLIVSLIGRHYAMDRDGNWNRIEMTYKLLTEGVDGKIVPQNIKEKVEKDYADGLDDRLLTPAIIGEFHPIQDNDSVIFFNFREDSMREITAAFADPNFNKFKRKELKNLCLTTMTEYDEKIKTNVAFPNDVVENPLGKVLADNQKTQLRIAESEKYAHVTYFFNSLKETPFPNEYRILIPSDKIARQDDHPEMMAEAVTDRALIALNEGGFDFILINYANADIVAHTGNYEATLKAIRTVDHQIERLMKTVWAGNHIMLITADHGNAEVLLDKKTGLPETKHNANPVPVYLVAKEFLKQNPDETIRPLQIIGLLSDVAPTVLELMDIPKPKDMTGQSLLKQLLLEK